MPLTLKPIKCYVNHNNWDLAERIELVSGNQHTMYAQLYCTLCDKVYHPALNSTVTLTFPRALTVAAVPVSQDVTVTMTVPYAGDNSVWMAHLNAQQTAIVAAGSAILSITENGVLRTYTVLHFVKKV